MIAFLAAAAALASVSPIDTVEEEIVVVGRRLQTVSVWLARDPNGRLACGMNRSSGDAKLDEQLCKVASRCLKSGAKGDGMKACIDGKKPMLLRQFKDRVRGKRYRRAEH